jgi:hypothetical protein
MSESDELSRFGEISSDFGAVSALFMPTGRIEGADAPTGNPQSYAITLAVSFAVRLTSS